MATTFNDRSLSFIPDNTDFPVNKIPGKVNPGLSQCPIIRPADGQLSTFMQDTILKHHVYNVIDKVYFKSTN